MAWYTALGDKHDGTLLFSESYSSSDDAYVRVKNLYAEAQTRQATGSRHKYVVFSQSTAPSAPSVDTGYNDPAGGPYTVHWTDGGGPHSETLENESHYSIRLQMLASDSANTNVSGDYHGCASGNISGVCQS